MTMTTNPFELEISFIETILILSISFIGAIIHESLDKSRKKKKAKPSQICLNIIITVFISMVFSLSIDPLICKINPRLILLPPLILSLLGIEFVSRMIHIESSFRLIEYIIGFFGIKKAKDTDFIKHHNRRKINNTNIDIDNDTPEEVSEAILSHMIDKVEMKVDLLIEEYEVYYKINDFEIKYEDINHDTNLIFKCIESRNNISRRLVIKILSLKNKINKLEDIKDVLQQKSCP